MGNPAASPPPSSSGMRRRSQAAVLGSLFVRDLGVFLRTTTALLFAVLTPVVMLVVFFGYLRAPLLTNMSSWLPDSSVAGHAGDAWIFATVALLSAFSSTASVLVGFLEDRSTGRFQLHLASGVKKWQIGCGYLLASVVASLVISLVILGLSQIWLGISGAGVMSVVLWLKAVSGLLMAAVFFTGLNGFAIALMASRTAVGAYTAIMGLLTLVFSFSLSPLSSTGLPSVTGILPFPQAGALVRHPLLAPILSATDTPTGGTDSFLATFGVAIRVGGDTATLWPTSVVVIILILWSVLAWFLALTRMTRTLRV